MSQLLIGIDCGVNTGMAVKIKGGAFISVASVKIHQAYESVKALHAAGHDLLVYVEDARKGGASPKMAAAKAQGAGSVKRDSKFWEDALTDLGIPFVLVAPKDNRTKLTAIQFKRATGWCEQTNEHGRDAGMLIAGR